MKIITVDVGVIISPAVAYDFLSSAVFHHVLMSRDANVVWSPIVSIQHLDHLKSHLKIKAEGEGTE
jgi:hypothetical protein